MYKRVKLKLCTFYKLPQVYIQSNITPFIAREDCQIIPDTPLVITPPLCHAGLENPNRNFTMPYQNEKSEIMHNSTNDLDI